MRLGQITFDENAKIDLLDLLGKSVDNDGFIVEKDHPTERVLTKNGEEIQLNEWAGLVKGSEEFVKSDTFSLIQLAKRIE